jgi:hypothetical protein
VGHRLPARRRALVTERDTARVLRVSAAGGEPVEVTRIEQADPGGEVCNGLRAHRTAWSDVEGFDVPKRGPVVLLRRTGAPLRMTALPRRDLRRLVQVGEQAAGAPRRLGPSPWPAASTSPATASSAVSASVDEELRDMDSSVQRLSGTSPSEAALRLAEAFADTSSMSQPVVVPQDSPGIGGPMLAASRRTVLLPAGTKASDPVVPFIDAHSAAISSVDLVATPEALKPARETAVEAPRRATRRQRARRPLRPLPRCPPPLATAQRWCLGTLRPMEAARSRATRSPRVRAARHPQQAARSAAPSPS